MFDSSVGGLGGCPFARMRPATSRPRTSSTRFERSGIDTGVDLERLIDVARWLAALLGRELPGMVYRAGPFVPSGVPAT